MLDTLQRSACARELSAFDMEKYLKNTDVSDSIDASVGHTTFDLTGWAGDLRTSCDAGNSKDQGRSPQQVTAEIMKMPTITQTEDKGEITMNTSSSKVCLSNISSWSSGHMNESRRSFVPIKSLSSTRRPVGSVQSSKSSAMETCISSDRAASENEVKPEQINPRTSNNMSSLNEQTEDKVSTASLNLPRTSSCKKKVSSALAQKARSTGNTGLQHQDIPVCSTGKKSSSMKMPSPLPCSSLEKHIDLSCQNTHPPPDPPCG